MKILVADDDHVARKVLRLLLEKEGYIVEVVDNGMSALQAMVAPDGPHVAIIDWMMPELDGPTVCRRVRSSQRTIRPHIIMLSSKAEKGDIVDALDAGADDYLSKPFSAVEMLARLRVAKRVIEYQLEVQAHVRDLGRLAANLAKANEAATAGKLPRGARASVAVDPAPTTWQRPYVRMPDELTRNEREQIIQHGFTTFGLPAEISAQEAPAPETGVLAAWTSFLMPERQIWTEWMIQVERADLTAIFEQHRGHPPSRDSELLDFLREIDAAIAKVFQGVMEHKNINVTAPFAPRARRADSIALPNSERHLCAIDGRFLHLAWLRHESPAQAKLPENLQSGDVLAEPYPPSDRGHVVLLNRGTVLNPRFIDKLTTFALMADSPPAHVFSPPPLAEAFNAMS